MSAIGTQDERDKKIKISDVTGRLTEADDDWLSRKPSSLFGGVLLFAEAGKKKKKEKSEVVVISVNNAKPEGHGGYPIYIPTCGGHGGGYGRRRRRR